MTCRSTKPSTASDLDDPAVAAQWDAGRFEIIDGILKGIPPADFSHGEAVFELLTSGGRDADTVRPSAFPDQELRSASLWPE